MSFSVFWISINFQKLKENPPGKRHSAKMAALRSTITLEWVPLILCCDWIKSD